MNKNKNNDPVVIVATQRTPIGQLQGAFNSFTAAQLGSFAIEGVIKQLNSFDEDAKAK